MNPIKKIQAERPLNLHLIGDNELPRMSVQVVMKGSEVAHIESYINALIVAPDRTFLYLESACSSDAGAHALMGCISDDTGTRVWNYFGPTWKDPISLTQPKLGMCNDYARDIRGFTRKLHHIAVLERTGTLILSTSEASLWNKLRSMMSCPTLPDWGEKVMPNIISSGMLVKCEHFGIGPKYIPYILAEDASAKFDRIIGEHVRSIGGIPKRSPIATLSKAVA